MPKQAALLELHRGTPVLAVRRTTFGHWDRLIDAGACSIGVTLTSCDYAICTGYGAASL